MRQEKESLELLTRTLGVEIFSPSACWLDGSSCPYGEPCGKFENRPMQYCHTNIGGCRKLAASSEFRVFLQPVVKEEVEEAQEKIKDEFHDGREPLSDFLKNQAKVLKEEGSINTTDEKILLSAVEVIKYVEEEGTKVFVFEVFDRAG